MEMVKEDYSFLDDYLLSITLSNGNKGIVFNLDSISDFKYLISAIRAKAGLSQADLAFELNTNQATVSQWENGVVTPTLKTVLMISEYIHTPILIGSL